MNSNSIQSWLIFPVVFSLAALTLPKQGLAANLTTQGKSAPGVAAAETGPPQIRIALEISPFEKITMRGEDGFVKHSFVKSKPTRQVLRARLERTNHFYFDKWHIETVPQQIKPDSKRYLVTLNIYERYGVLGNLEELVGSLTTSGLLEGNSKIYKLIGQSQKEFKNKQGEPLLKIYAGFPSPKQLADQSAARKSDVAKSNSPERRVHLQ